MSDKRLHANIAVNLKYLEAIAAAEKKQKKQWAFASMDRVDCLIASKEVFL